MTTIYPDQYVYLDDQADHQADLDAPHVAYWLRAMKDRLVVDFRRDVHLELRAAHDARIAGRAFRVGRGFQYWKRRCGALLHGLGIASSRINRGMADMEKPPPAKRWMRLLKTVSPD